MIIITIAIIKRKITLVTTIILVRVNDNSKNKNKLE